jgi:hypothetical protein
MFIYLLLVVVVAFFQDVQIDRFVRVASPYLLLAIGFGVGRASLSDITVLKLKQHALVASIVATVFTVAYGFISTGDVSGDIRYQILSPMMFVAVPLLTFNIWILRTNLVASAGWLIFILYFIFLSATRSWLLAYISIVSIGMLLHGYILGGVIKTVSIGALKFLSVAAVFTAFLLLVSPDSVSRMADRFFSADSVGFDITTATRLAEIDYQLESWLADANSFLFGKGLGAAYGFGGQNIEYLYSHLGADGVAIDWWFAGHNFWVYSLFSQGIILGLVLPALIVFVFISSLKEIIMKNRWIGHDQESFKFIQMTFLVTSSILVSTIGGNPLGNRMFSLYIGIFLGVAVAASNAKKRPAIPIF